MLTVKFGKTFRLVMTLACAIFLLQSIALNVSIAHSCLPLVGTLDVEVDVGSIHFRGEMAEFYILVSYLGKPVDAEISAMLYYNGTMYADLSAFVEHIATGLYRVPYTIPMEASAGSYALVVGASSPWLKWNELTIPLAGSYALVVGPSHRTLEGTTLECFLLSSTLTSWNAWITDVHGNLTTIKTDVGTIMLSLESLDAKLASIDGRIFAIETNMGTIKVDIDDIDLRLTNIEGGMVTMSTALGDINGTIVSIRGDIANITTDLGEIKMSLPPAETTALGIPILSIFAVIAAIASTLSAVVLLRKSKANH